MRNEFLPHEGAFEAWVDGGFEPCEPATLDYLRFLADPEDERRPRPAGLWRHQWEALLRVVYAREAAGRSLWGEGVLLDIVTGGGKTALIAAAMVWLRLAHQVQRFLILCPNLIVRDRLEADFREGRVFRERGLIPPNAYLSPDDFALTMLGGTSQASAADLFGANVVLTNIHQFYRGSARGQENLWAFLDAAHTPFAVFNDEAHNTPAPQYDLTLQELRGRGGFSFRLDTTATPDRADGKAVDSAMIYEYDIPAALHDRVIATPVVYQPDIETVELTYTDVDSGQTRRVEEIDWDDVDRAGLSATQWVTDPKPMSQQISIALNRLDEAKRSAAGRWRPVLFVVAVCKADARAAKHMLDTQFNVRTLIVTEDEDEQARRDAAALGDSGKYDAVVSVAMLREGWDVPEVGVVLLLRKFGSKVYGPQVVGRGLRRVRRPGVEPDEPQICAVVDHPKLEHGWLWELLRARVRRKVGVDDVFEEEGELGELPPRQEVVDRSLLIEIPAPDDDDDGGLDPVVVDPPPEAARDWRERLANLDYREEAVEITDQTLSGVTGRELSPDGWTRTQRAPAAAAAPFPPDLPPEQAREKIHERVREIALQAVVNAGYSAQMQRFVYRPLLEHLAERFNDGEPLVFAEPEAVYRVASRLNELDAHVQQRPDIVGGMVEYGSA